MGDIITVQSALLLGWRSSDSTVQPARIDRATNTIQTIDYEHHEIHSGSSFTANYAADIGNGANMDVLVITPNSKKWAHLIYEWDVESETHFYIYEQPTINANGTAITAYNRNRNSTESPTVLVFYTPTVGAVNTTILRSIHIGSGRSSGGAHRGSSEWILKQNEKYLIRFTNATANNNYMSLRLDWYEHTDVG